MSITVANQTELDKAIASGVKDIIINSPAGVWLTVRAYDSSTVRAYGSSTVTAYDSSTVTAYGSSTVRACDSSTVRATPHVAVHLHSRYVKVGGGVVIDVIHLNEITDPKAWCENHGVTVKRGKATLFKALDADLFAGHSYTKTKYEPGTTVTADDWRDDNSCGNGLHLGPSTGHATAYRRDAGRWVRVEVPVKDLRPIPGGTAKCKVRSCRVVAEVDLLGRDL